MSERPTPSTIVDVAKAAGVSVATVSRALRGLDRVSPGTRERVRRVAEELHYVASPTATSLASGRTYIVGVVVPFPSRWYFSAMVSAIGKALREKGYQVLLFDLEEEVFDSRQSLTRSMLWKRVDGVISINVPMTDEELDLLGGLHVPVISLGIPLTGRMTVGIDDAAAARTATEHLLELGHTEVAFIGAGMDAAALVETPRARLQAFRDALEAREVPIREDWILASTWTAQDAREKAHSILVDPDTRPTGIVCGSDEIALGCYVAARGLNIAIPSELSIVGIDDFDLASLFDLTTVRQDITEQGKKAVSLLLEELDNKGKTPSPAALLMSAREPKNRDVFVDTELVIRASTAPPRS